MKKEKFRVLKLLRKIDALYIERQRLKSGEVVFEICGEEYNKLTKQDLLDLSAEIANVANGRGKIYD